LEYEFTVVYKLGKTHVGADILSKLLDSLEPFGVPNQTVNASLYSIEHIWMYEVKSYLETNRCQKL
jgi:VanZ family protein